MINVNGVEAWSLLDTGSQITTISEKLYEEIKNKNKISEMPVSNIIVSTAIGSKNKTVKKQILIEIECDGFKNTHICLTIPHLSSNIILGNDWNLKNGVGINYKKQTIEVKERVISSKSVLFERGVSDKLFISQNDEMTFIYVITLNDHEIDKETNNIINTSKIDLLCDYDVNDDVNKNLIGDEITENYTPSNMKISEININVNNEQQIVCRDDNATRNNLSKELRSIASGLTVLTNNEKILN